MRAVRWLFQNVICHARIGTRYAIEHVVERNLSTFGIAAFTGLNQPLGFVYGGGVDEDHPLVFRCRIEEVEKLSWHGTDSIIAPDCRLR